MTRYLFPDDRLVYNIGPTNSTFVSAHNQQIKVFLDGAASEPATNLQTFPDQESITNSTLTIDNNSQIPQFYGPPDVTSLYVQSVFGGEVGQINTDLQDRVNVVESGSKVTVYQLPYSFPGPLGVKTGTLRFYVEEDCTWLSGRAAVGTASTSTAIILDVKKNAFDGGGTIYTTSAHRPTLAPNVHTQASPTPDITAFAPGDYITVDVAQVVDGSDMTYVVRLLKN